MSLSRRDFLLSSAATILTVTLPGTVFAQADPLFSKVDDGQLARTQRSSTKKSACCDTNGQNWNA